ncbi:UNVERIFIED_CONTAM: E3 ubiquitin-protein ligase AIRP2 [Sesamum angustifolium]|uniref:E3 ubiquitin-protein ligase AIRP2 n=1 Tax=Sesamum angustifolium TaxID=2727405 RepID=A0AAW2MSZ2_9LAMI
MRKSFKDSLKALEADIQHANTLASDYSREYDGACLQMRLSYSPCADIFLFLFQWTDCHLAGVLGLIRILIYKVYGDGKTTMSVYEEKASLSEFYGVIFPSLLQLHKGITDIEEKKQREICATKYRRRDEMEKGKLSEIEIEREEECGICMEMDTKEGSITIVSILSRQSEKGELRGTMDLHKQCDITDLSAIGRENVKRLFMYIDKLPLVIPDPVVVSYAPHFR